MKAHRMLNHMPLESDTGTGVFAEGSFVYFRRYQIPVFSITKLKKHTYVCMIILFYICICLF